MEDEYYHKVVCDQCGVHVAMMDQDEVYHFFNVIPTTWNIRKSNIVPLFRVPFLFSPLSLSLFILIRNELEGVYIDILNIAHFCINYA